MDYDPIEDHKCIGFDDADINTYSNNGDVLKSGIIYDSNIGITYQSQCPKCLLLNAENTEFCPNCGYKFDVIYKQIPNDISKDPKIKKRVSLARLIGVALIICSVLYAVDEEIWFLYNSNDFLRDHQIGYLILIASTLLIAIISYFISFMLIFKKHDVVGVILYIIGSILWFAYYQATNEFFSYTVFHYEVNLNCITLYILQTVTIFASIIIDRKSSHHTSKTYGRAETVCAGFILCASLYYIIYFTYTLGQGGINHIIEDWTEDWIIVNMVCLILYPTSLVLFLSEKRKTGLIFFSIINCSLIIQTLLEWGRTGSLYLGLISICLHFIIVVLMICTIFFPDPKKKSIDPFEEIFIKIDSGNKVSINRMFGDKRTKKDISLQDFSVGVNKLKEYADKGDISCKTALYMLYNGSVDPLAEEYISKWYSKKSSTICKGSKIKKAWKVPKTYNRFIVSSINFIAAGMAVIFLINRFNADEKSIQVYCIAAIILSLVAGVVALSKSRNRLPLYLLTSVGAMFGLISVIFSYKNYQSDISFWSSYYFTFPMTIIGGLLLYCLTVYAPIRKGGIERKLDNFKMFTNMLRGDTYFKDGFGIWEYTTVREETYEKNKQAEKILHLNHENDICTDWNINVDSPVTDSYNGISYNITKNDFSKRIGVDTK